MKPVPFTFQNSVFGSGQPEYLPLPAHKHNNSHGHVTSCWELSWRELWKILFTKKVYLTLATFDKPIQPQKLTVYNPCFPSLRKVEEESMAKAQGDGK